MLIATTMPLLAAAHLLCINPGALTAEKSALSAYEPNMCANLRITIIANGRRKGPGPDHGDDPHNENHDGGLPANQHAGDGRAPTDPYGGIDPFEGKDSSKK